MTVNIPLPWQLTDFLTAMGLGFAMGLLYFIFCAPLHRRSSAPIAPPVPQKPHPQQRRKRRRRIRVAAAADIVWAFFCLVLARGWAVSTSRAAQLRGSSLLGLALGCILFFSALSPVLTHCLAFAKRLLHRGTLGCFAALCRVCLPLRRLSRRLCLHHLTRTRRPARRKPQPAAQQPPCGAMPQENKSSGAPQAAVSRRGKKAANAAAKNRQKTGQKTGFHTRANGIDKA